MRKLSLMNLSNCGLEKEEMKEVLAGGACTCGCACTCIDGIQDSSKGNSRIAKDESSIGLLSAMGPAMDDYFWRAWDLSWEIYNFPDWKKIWEWALCR